MKNSVIFWNIIWLIPRLLYIWYIWSFNLHFGEYLPVLILICFICEFFIFLYGLILSLSPVSKKMMKSLYGEYFIIIFIYKIIIDIFVYYFIEYLITKFILIVHQFNKIIDNGR